MSVHVNTRHQAAQRMVGRWLFPEKARLSKYAAFAALRVGKPEQACSIAVPDKKVLVSAWRVLTDSIILPEGLS